MAEDEFFLSRWSRRKAEARRGELPGEPVPAPPLATPAAGAVAAPKDAEPAPLPPVESLTPESDFAPFMRQDVESNLRGQALRTLFSDPRFNVMDGLDVYIDDYSKPDPLPPEWLARMSQAAFSGHRTAEEKAEDAAREAAEAQKQEPEIDAAAAASDTASEPDHAPKVGDSGPSGTAE